MRPTHIRFLSLLASLAVCSCATSSRLHTASGKPEVALRNKSWKDASIAIASYNLSKGRELDNIKPGVLVLYESVPTSDGTPQVTSKIVYALEQRNDSLYIFSKRFATDDLDDDSASEAADEASLDAQQQELEEIAKILSGPIAASDRQN